MSIDIKQPISIYTYMYKVIKGPLSIIHYIGVGDMLELTSDLPIYTYIYNRVVYT